MTILKNALPQLSHLVFSLPLSSSHMNIQTTQIHSFVLSFVDIIKYFVQEHLDISQSKADLSLIDLLIKYCPHLKSIHLPQIKCLTTEDGNTFFNKMNNFLSNYSTQLEEVDLNMIPFDVSQATYVFHSPKKRYHKMRVFSLLLIQL
jgi:hypothetical protein